MLTTRFNSEKNQGKYRVRIQPTDNETGNAVSIPGKITRTNSKIAAKLFRRKDVDSLPRRTV